MQSGIRWRRRGVVARQRQQPALGARALEQHGDEPPRIDRRDRAVEEDPGVSAFPRARDLRQHRNARVRARGGERPGVVRLGAVVEVGDDEAAARVPIERVEPDDVLAEEMPADDVVGQRQMVPALVVDEPALAGLGRRLPRRHP